LIHRRFIKKLLGETVIKFPTKSGALLQVLVARKRLARSPDHASQGLLELGANGPAPGSIQRPLYARMLSVGSP
jgi:hypothetical protein